MAKKINVAVLKEFMFNHGEKVALGTCAFLALLFGVMGLLHAMGAGKADGSSKTYAEEFTSNTVRVKQSMASHAAPVLPDNVKARMNPANGVWGELTSDYPPLPYIIQSEPNTSKRTQPLVLPILAKGTKQIQMDYVRALAFVHDIEKGNLLCLEPKDDAKLVDQPIEKKVKGPNRDKPPQGSLLIPPVTRKAEPIRAVVVSAVFPMRRQVEEFQKALRMTSQEDMFKIPREDLPNILGFNVIKFEIVAGKRVNEEGEVLIYVDWTSKEKVKDKPVQVNKQLDDLLRIAIYDEDTPEMLKEHIWHGLNTPLPKLANARYPKFDFEGIEYAYFEEDEVKKDLVAGKDVKIRPNQPPGLGGKRDPKRPPIGNDPKQPEVAYKVKEISPKELKAAEPALALRLFPKDKDHDKIVNKYNIFHVLGLEQPSKEDGVIPPVNMRPPNGGPGLKFNDPNRYFSAWDFGLPNAAGGVLPPAPPKKDKKDDLNQKPVYPNWDRDAVVRFIDPGAVPGKTYQYAVQIRMANPNFGKNVAEVAFGDLTRLEELPPSEWVYTPTVTIPAEYFLYAVDQRPDSQVPVNPKAAPPVRLDKEHTAFQIHQWTDRARDQENNGPELAVGDWVIGERIVVRRGEAIGSQVDVRAPIWVKIKNAFEMPMMKIVEGKTKKDKQGFKIDFKGDGERPILVDFVGGKRLKSDGKVLDEETAVDALVLTADGKLTVLNSRAGEFAVENDRPGQPDRPDPVSRQTRVERARIAADAALPPTALGDPKLGKQPGRGP